MFFIKQKSGKLVTVIAKERRDLDVDARNWVDDRINRKGETIKQIC